jgi:hypothetical protein
MLISNPHKGGFYGVRRLAAAFGSGTSRGEKSGGAAPSARSKRPTVPCRAGCHGGAPATQNPVNPLSKSPGLQSAATTKEALNCIVKVRTRSTKPNPTKLHSLHSKNVFSAPFQHFCQKQSQVPFHEHFTRQQCVFPIKPNQA